MNINEKCLIKGFIKFQSSRMCVCVVFLLKISIIPLKANIYDRFFDTDFYLKVSQKVFLDAANLYNFNQEVEVEVKNYYNLIKHKYLLETLAEIRLILEVY